MLLMKMMFVEVVVPEIVSVGENVDTPCLRLPSPLVQCSYTHTFAVEMWLSQKKNWRQNLIIFLRPILLVRFGEFVFEMNSIFV